jgi:hypothetical protein
MSWIDKVGSLLKQYTTSGGAVAQPAPDVHAHFDEVAQAAPTSAIAEGLTAAFNSDKTPAFGQMLSTLFNSEGWLTLPPAPTHPCTPRPELSGWAEILSATVFQFAHRK